MSSSDAAISIALRLVDNATAPMNKAMAMVERSTGGAERQMQMLASTARMAVGVFAALGLSLGISEIIKTADTWKNLHGRLMLVTESAEQLADVEQRLFAVAQNTRVGYEETATLYARIARSTQDMNLGQEKTLAITDTINKTLIVSGSSAQAADAALIQLGQGFASGALRGQELNSVLEQAPRLAEAIADGMGVSVGQLRKLGEEGKLTAEAVVQALVSQASAVNDEFAKMPKTVGQAGVVINNTLGKMISGLDTAGGLTGVLSEKIIELAGVVERNGKPIIYTFAAIGDAIYFPLKLVAEVTEAIIATGFEVVKFFEMVENATSGNMRAAKQNWRELQGIIDDFSKSTGDRWSTSNIESARQMFNAPKPPYQPGKADPPPVPDPPVPDKAAEAAAKAHGAALDSVLKRLLPLRAEQQAYEADLKLLDELLAKHQLTTGEYGTALDNLTKTTAEYKEETERVTKALEYKTQANEDLITLEKELDLAGMSKDQREIQGIKDTYDLLLNKSHLYTLMGHQTEEAEAQFSRAVGVNMQKDLDDLAAKGDETAKALDEAFSGWASNMSQDFNDMLWSAEFSFQGIAESFGKMITQMMIQASIAEPMLAAYKGAGGVSGIMGSLFGSSGFSAETSFAGAQADLSYVASAQGNVFSSPGIDAYRNSIVSSPTLFAFASGIGLMGEKPGSPGEAIMPLTRMPSGDLGVKAQGGGANVQVNVINNATGTVATKTERTDSGGTRIIDVLVEQIEGKMGARVAQGKGLAPIFESRYALNSAFGMTR